MFSDKVKRGKWEAGTVIRWGYKLGNREREGPAEQEQYKGATDNG